MVQALALEYRFALPGKPEKLQIIHELVGKGRAATGMVDIVDPKQVTLAKPRRHQCRKDMAKMEPACRAWREARHRRADRHAFLGSVIHYSSRILVPGAGVAVAPAI